MVVGSHLVDVNLLSTFYLLPPTFYLLQHITAVRYMSLQGREKGMNWVISTIHLSFLDIYTLCKIDLRLHCMNYSLRDIMLDPLIALENL